MKVVGNGAQRKLQSIRMALEQIESDRADVLLLGEQLIELVKMLERVSVGDVPMDDDPWPE